MTVKDYMMRGGAPVADRRQPTVSADAHILEALAAWRGSADRCVAVLGRDAEVVGTLTAEALLTGLADIFTPAPEGSLVEVSCATGEYSASHIARAVEDADASLLGLWRLSHHESGTVSALLMTGVSDATAVCRSLRRYGYEAVAKSGSLDADLRTALQNIEALKMYLEI